jgi:hypothetical protein
LTTPELLKERMEIEHLEEGGLVGSKEDFQVAFRLAAFLFSIGRGDSLQIASDCRFAA